VSTQDLSKKMTHVKKELVKFCTWMDNLAGWEKVTEAKRTRWTDFYSRFAPDGTIDWETFQRYLKWDNGYGDCNLIWSLLDGSDKGFVNLRVFLEMRKTHVISRDLMYDGTKGLQKLLVGKFGSLSRAWRSVFDTQDIGRCGYQNFVKSCKAHGFTTNVHATWKEISKTSIESDTGFNARNITMKDWDPTTHRCMVKFCGMVVEKFGCSSDDWVSCLRKENRKGDRQGSGRVDKEEWISLCSCLKLRETDALRIFDCLNKSNDGRIDERDFENIGAIYAPEEINKKKELLASSVMSSTSGGGQKAFGGGRVSPRKLVFSGDSKGNRGKNKKNQGGWSGGDEVKRAEQDEEDREPEAIEFVVELTKQEYNEYLALRRADEVSQGALSKRDADQLFPGGVVPLGTTIGNMKMGSDTVTSGTMVGGRRLSVSSNSSARDWNKVC